MHKFATSAVIALSALTSLAAAGSAVIKNSCPYPVYLWSVADGPGTMVTLDASTGTYSEAYRARVSGGVSIKLANTTSTETVLQFEYTLTGPTTWYDLSYINGGYTMFDEGTVQLTPTTKTCTVVACKSGVTRCQGVYNDPDENSATCDCDSDADLELELCMMEEGMGKRAPVESEVEIQTRHTHGHRRHVPPQARARRV